MNLLLSKILSIKQSNNLIMIQIHILEVLTSAAKIFKMKEWIGKKFEIFIHIFF